MDPGLARLLRPPARRQSRRYSYSPGVHTGHNVCEGIPLSPDWHRSQAEPPITTWLHLTTSVTSLTHAQQQPTYWWCTKVAEASHWCWWWWQTFT